MGEIILSRTRIHEIAPILHPSATTVAHHPRKLLGPRFLLDSLSIPSLSSLDLTLQLLVLLLQSLPPLMLSKLGPPIEPHPLILAKLGIHPHVDLPAPKLPRSLRKQELGELVRHNSWGYPAGVLG